jgi:plasmid stabilization system protein ParE
LANVIVSPEALADLADIGDYIARDKPQAANVAEGSK